MKVTWHGQVIAESNQTIALDGYHYFPPASVRMEFLQPAPKTAADHRCPHSVLTRTSPTGSGFGMTSKCNAPNEILYFQPGLVGPNRPHQ